MRRREAKARGTSEASRFPPNGPLALFARRRSDPSTKANPGAVQALLIVELLAVRGHDLAATATTGDAVASPVRLNQPLT